MADPALWSRYWREGGAAGVGHDDYDDDNPLVRPAHLAQSPLAFVRSLRAAASDSSLIAGAIEMTGRTHKSSSSTYDDGRRWQR